MGLQSLSWGPNDLPFHILRTNKVFLKGLSAMTLTDLGELEDLFYATCGKLKDLLGRVNLYLSNNFKAPKDDYFTYTIRAYKHLGPITVEEFKSFLLAQEEILYHAGMIKVMNKAVLRKHEQEAAAKERREAYKGGSDSTGNTRDSQNNHNKTKRKSRQQSDTEGLRDVREECCGMIFGELAEKYRPILYKEQLSPQQERFVRRHYSALTEHEGQESNTPVKYVSPPNLGERDKSPYLSRSAEFPCICNPECLDTPLCATELSQNCLCKQDSLFCQLAEGWDAGDLEGDLNTANQWVVDNGVARILQVGDNGDINAQASTSLAGVNQASSKPVTEDVPDLSQKLSDGMTSEQLRSCNNVSTSVPEHQRSLSIWATPAANLGSGQSLLWHDLPRLYRRSWSPPANTRNFEIDNCPPEETRIPISARNRFPSARRIFDICHRGRMKPRDTSQIVCLSDKEVARQQRVKALAENESEEIVFNGVTYVVRRLF